MPPHLPQVESRVTPCSIFVFSWRGKPLWGGHRPWRRDFAHMNEWTGRGEKQSLLQLLFQIWWNRNLIYNILFFQVKCYTLINTVSGTVKWFVSHKSIDIKGQKRIIDLLWMTFIAQQQLGYLYGARSPNPLETSAVLNVCNVSWICLHVRCVSMLTYKFELSVVYCHGTGLLILVWWCLFFYLL